MNDMLKKIKFKKKKAIVHSISYSHEKIALFLSQGLGWPVIYQKGGGIMGERGRVEFVCLWHEPFKNPAALVYDPRHRPQFSCACGFVASSLGEVYYQYLKLINPNLAKKRWELVMEKLEQSWKNFTPQDDYFQLPQFKPVEGKGENLPAHLIKSWGSVKQFSVK